MMNFSVITAPTNIREKTEALLNAMEEGRQNFLDTAQSASLVQHLFNPLRLSDTARKRAGDLKEGLQILRDDLSKAHSDSEIQAVRVKAFFLIASITPYNGLKQEIHRHMIGASSKGRLDDERYIESLISLGETNKIFAKGKFAIVWREKIKQIDLGGKVGLTLGDVMRKEVDEYLSRFSPTKQKEQIEMFTTFIDNVFLKELPKSQRSTRP